MTPTRTIPLAALAVWCLAGATAWAQPTGPGRFRPPAFLRELFPPQLIMRHQSEIGLTDAQREAITKEMTAAQAEAVDLRWKVEERTATLTKLLAVDQVDETAALAKADELLALERQLKRVRLALMIRVKNRLTPAQQASLRTLAPIGPRDRAGPGERRGGPPEPPDLPEPPEGPEL